MEILKKLAKLDFSNKGESYVESKFLTPLLECLGYENHKDYEVFRHGDNEINFKLGYPPVENGAKKVKHYNPDYIPTIRKKIFWIIEAKSSKIKKPCEYNYLVQGLQYCIHPEIQAKYLILSNGIETCIYDVQSAILLNEDIYEPILKFKNTELLEKWEEIYKILSVEKVRIKIEEHLKLYYEKLCLSSLDSSYPTYLQNFITKEKYNLKNEIDKHVRTLYMEERDKEYKNESERLQNANIEELKIEMEYPLGRGSNNPSIFYVEKLLLDMNENDTFKKLIEEYELFSYFQKEHCFVAICHLFNISKNEELKDKIKQFITDNADKKLSLLNKSESLLLRIIRKYIMIYQYPLLRKSIEKSLETAPELIKYVYKPRAQNYTFANELTAHDNYFIKLKKMKENQLLLLIPQLEAIEKSLEEDFKQAEKMQPRDEQEIGGGFERYGEGDKIWSLKHIAKNNKILDK